MKEAMRPAGTSTRRGFLKATGTVVAALPLVQLAGCAEESESAAAPSAPEPTGRTPEAKPRAAPSAPAPQTAGAGGTGTPARLEESDATAEALGYRHVATDVDAGRFPRYQPGQTCANCSLYQADASADAAWGGCSIFPGRLVDARGWCNAYVRGA